MTPKERQDLLAECGLTEDGELLPAGADDGPSALSIRGYRGWE